MFVLHQRFKPKSQKRVCRTDGLSFGTLLEPYFPRHILASSGLFCRRYFGRCSCELAQLVPLPHSRWRSIRCSDRLHDFPVTVPRC